MLKWIFERCDGEGKAEETPIGFMPAIDSIEPPESMTEADMAEMLSIDKESWLKEVESIRTEHYSKFGAKLPQELMDELDALEDRLKKT